VRLVDTIYRIMTNPEEDVSLLLPGQPAGVSIPAAASRGAPAFQMLPHVGVDELTGFIERLHDLGGREDLYDLARDLQMEADELLPLAEAADMLGFGDIVEGDILLLPEGVAFAEAGVQEEKTLFRQQALPHIVLLGEIMDGLRAEPDHRLQEDHLLEQLQAYFSPAESRRQLDTAIDWGRYAELFSYDDEEGEFFLEEDATPSA
jgi:NitT/TauT family transport system ATP-binding protein